MSDKLDKLYVYEPPEPGLPFLVVEFNKRGLPHAWRHETREEAEAQASEIPEARKRLREKIGKV